MRILVTGGNGFIGSHLVKHLRQLNVGEVFSTFRAYKRSQNLYTDYCVDLEKEDETVKLLEYTQPDIVFHFAGNPRVKENAHDKTSVTKLNTLATHNLLANLPKYCKFVLASSATVYGEGTLSQHLECSPVRPTSAYAASKIGAEALVNAYAALGRIEPLILRLVANVGTGASHGLLPDIINKLKSKGGTIELIGDSPGTIKQFCHVDDTCMVAATLAFSGHSGIFNAVSYDSSPISVESVARIAMESTGITKKIKWLGGSSIWPGDNRVVNIAGQKLYMETNIVVSDSVKAIAIASKELYEEARV